MRLDKFLQLSRLVKRRSIANTLCSRGAVSVNGHVAKAGKTLAIGDVIRLPRASSALEELPDAEYEVLELPKGNISRARAATLYRPLNPDLAQAEPA